MAYAECFVLALPLRECAVRCGVCLKTACTMRHRVIECLSAYAPAFTVERGCGCELDETYFPESFKGNHTKGSFTIPRINSVHSQLDGFMARFRGVSTKHLQAYLSWFRRRIAFAVDGEGDAETVARQLSGGLCRTRTAEMFNVRPPLMGYWETNMAA